MQNRKSTKRALVSSALAMVTSAALLIGTTFAWFTDTASTGVNKIVSGNLKVDIVDPDDSTHLDTLNFKKAAGAEDKQLLWEPGCRYLTEGFKIVNNGNLALKWKAEINKDNAVDGKVSADAKDKSLLDAIDFYVVTSTEENAEAVKIENFTGELAATSKTNDTYYIKGVMQPDAGNEYQNLTLDGITITVYATQNTVESDSFDNEYDASATYPVSNTADLATALNDGKSVTVANDLDPKEPIAVTGDVTATVDLNGNTVANTADIWAGNNWSLFSAQNGADLTISGNGTVKAKENDCYAVDVQDGSTVTIKNGTFIGNIHAVYVHEGTAYIEGGFYAIQQTYYPDASKAYEFVLNCYDANREAGTAKIIVTGGTFVNFNPADCQAEGANTNFVADGYKVVSEKQSNGDVWYTVVKA